MSKFCQNRWTSYKNRSTVCEVFLANKGAFVNSLANYAYAIALTLSENTATVGIRAILSFPTMRQVHSTAKEIETFTPPTLAVHLDKHLTLSSI